MARDPRLRPFRVALWAIYLTVTAVAVGLAIRSIVKNLRGPHRPAATAALPTRAAFRVCVGDLEELHREQSTRAFRLGADVAQGADAVARWSAWSREWEQRVDDLSDRCHLDTEDPEAKGFTGRAELARARDAVLAVHRAYTLQVNRFAAEQAEVARAAADALEKARAAQRPPSSP